MIIIMPHINNETEDENSSLFLEYFFLLLLSSFVISRPFLLYPTSSNRPLHVGRRCSFMDLEEEQSTNEDDDDAIT